MTKPLCKGGSATRSKVYKVVQGQLTASHTSSVLLFDSALNFVKPAPDKALLTEPFQRLCSIAFPLRLKSHQDIHRSGRRLNLVILVQKYSKIGLAVMCHA
jgi:hypothetical protein